MDITTVLVQFFGVVFTVFGLSMVINKKGMAAAFAEMVQNRSFFWLAGFFTVVLGAALVALNNVWTSGWTLLVTIIGWLVLIKGAFILFLPKTAEKFYKKYTTDDLLAFYGVVAFIIGLVFLYWGFM